MVNLYLWFDNDMAYWLNITNDTADRIMDDFRGCGLTNHFIETVY